MTKTEEMSKMDGWYLCLYPDTVLETTGGKWVKSTRDHSASLLSADFKATIISVRFLRKKKDT